ncbi:MAG: HEPN domain-containing protein [Candidatus Methylumidiphilus sp.]
MTPEAESFLRKACGHLERGRIMLSVNLYEDAGRAAYLAGFHAAQALIFERIGKALKTHNGVQAEFLRLTKEALEPELRVFLSQAYNLKAVADYEEGPDAGISSDRAEAAIKTAGHFVERIRRLTDLAP